MTSDYLPEWELVAHYWTRVDVRGRQQCWPWQGYIATNGYGHLDRRLAHRIGYRLANGEEADTVDHLCRNKSCQNPRHMESVTAEENVRRLNTKAEDELCPQGHLVTGPNRGSSGSGRRCRACFNSRQNERKAAKRMEMAA